jgi:hypothetical protein
MRTVNVSFNLTDKEVATIEWIGMSIEEYIQSIVHHDLGSTAPADLDDFPEETSPDHNLL